MTNTKVCTDCLQELPRSRDHFSRMTKSPDGFHTKCKLCMGKRAKDWHQLNPHSRIESGLKFKFNITLVEYNAMFAAQAGACKICGKHQSILKKRLAVDHCHATGKIRGLLCQNCNNMLGHAKDNPQTLIAAAEYLNG